jgi:hypothetical protein
MNFKTFLLNKSSDHKGRMLTDIYKFSDNEIEATHDFIQIVFPLAEPSYWSSNKYFIESQQQIDSLSSDKNVKEAILQSASWYVSFLKRNNHWKNVNNHNLKRITRMIKSVRLIVGDIEADKIKKEIISFQNIEKLVGQKSIKYWKNA